ncbi:hypothetical protein DSCA_55880 [Desulfosarcina alkanivorans]|jgi:hypothetical protein|uniref:LysM domain-containing protein n=1 Tax=Desulfosarcina alkanivorans TaxID=571177 RepID=A0A5K7YSP2_9BACT|nr:LysM peptidoglycan-binding domain-containing protein [Desulfosarcina alkanivorans]BBO71658.1 hypothetical protein DSCA_55880 [Desulfosarcina alkanivorans]
MEKNQALKKYRIFKLIFLILLTAGAVGFASYSKGQRPSDGRHAEADEAASSAVTAYRQAGEILTAAAGPIEGNRGDTTVYGRDRGSARSSRLTEKADRLAGPARDTGTDRAHRPLPSLNAVEPAEAGAARPDPLPVHPATPLDAGASTAEKAAGLCIGVPPRGRDLGTRYVVAACESLSVISERTGVGIQHLIDRNPQVANPDLIYPGQELRLPPRG